MRPCSLGARDVQVVPAKQQVAIGLHNVGNWQSSSCMAWETVIYIA